MARGKQAAKAANRRAVKATEKAEEVKARLAKERQDSDQLIKELREENTRLRDGIRAEAERMAAEEVQRLNEEKALLAEQLNQAREAVREVMKTKEYLVFSACRYISMTKGFGPGRAFEMVYTWMTGEDYTGIYDVEKSLTKLALPPDGWVAENLRRNTFHERMVAQSQLFKTEGAVSLDRAEEEEYPDIHPQYQPHWYKEQPPVRIVNRRSKSTQVVYKTKLGVQRRPSSG